MTNHASAIADAKALLVEDGYAVIKKDRVQVLTVTVSIADEIKYLGQPSLDYMDYAKQDATRTLAHELGDAITWSITPDKYIPCTRIGAKLIVVMPK